MENIKESATYDKKSWNIKKMFSKQSNEISLLKNKHGSISHEQKKSVLPTINPHKKSPNVTMKYLKRLTVNFKRSIKFKGKEKCKN